MTNLPSTEQARAGAILSAAALGFGLGEVLALVLVTAVAAGLGALNGVSGLTSTVPHTWWANALGLFGLWIGMIGAVHWAAHQGSMPWPSDAWRWRSWRDAGFVLVGVASQFLVDLAYRPWHLHTLNAPVQRLFGSTNALEFTLLALATGLVAPVVEECFFRATVFRALHGVTMKALPRGGTAVAIAISALLFALAHGELVQIPGLFMIGVVLAVVYARVQRVLPCVLVHVGFNLTTVGVLFSQRFGH